MTSRLRDRRRKSERTPGIWRGPAGAEATAERPVIEHGSKGRVFVSWRAFSALIVFCLVIVLMLFFSSDAFYVHSVSVGGLHYLSKEEIFTFANIANLHIFWVDPEQVRRDVLREPTVADATVYISWPPDMVQIIVEERAPAMIWVQAGVSVWVDLQGRVMRLREDRTDLPQILVDDLVEGAIGGNVLVPTDVVNGAIQLAELLPQVNAFRYNPDRGLGYLHPSGWQVWFGVGSNMSEKMLIYQAIEQNLLSRGIVPYAIDVENPDAPYICIDDTPCARRTS